MSDPPLKDGCQQVFRVELTASEASALADLIPFGYSLHVEPKKKHQRVSVSPQLSSDQERSNLSHRYRRNHLKSHKAMAKSTISKKDGESSLTSKTKEKPIPVLPQPAKQSPSSLKWLEQLPTENHRKWANILIQLKSSSTAIPFLEPVDTIAMAIPEYYEMISEPMDLQRVEAKLREGKYSDFIEFQADILKIIDNSYKFNKTNEQFVKITSDFQNLFQRVVVDPVAVSQKQAKLLKKKKKKITLNHKEFNESIPLTVPEKKQLAQELRRLAKQHMPGVLSIVYENQEQLSPIFDLEELSNKKLRELQKYVRNKIIQMQDRKRCRQEEKKESTNFDAIDSDESPFPEQSHDS